MFTRDPQRSQTLTNVLSGLTLFIVATLLLLSVGWQRFLAADEGFYLLAGRLVATGKTPYQDFFYPQMPLLPYLHAFWIKLFTPDWYTARLIVCLISALSVATLFFAIRLYTNLLLALLGGLSILLQPEFITWYTVAKTYSFETLPLLFSLAGVMYGTKCLPVRYLPFLLGVAGFSLGCSVSIRLFSIGLLPLFFAFLFIKGRLRATSPFLLGFVLAMAPHLYFIFGDFDSYWFNNVGYHLIRLHRPPEVEALAKQNVAMLVFGLKSGLQTDGFAIPVVFWLSLLSILWSVKEKKVPPLALFLGLTLFLLYFVPSPTHHQYFATTLPLLIVGIAIGEFPYRFRLLALILLLLQGVYFLPNTITRLTTTGSGIKGIDDATAELMTLKNMQILSDELEQEKLSGCTVIALWPGLLFATELTPYPGLENQFWQRVEGKLNEEQLSRYRIINREALRMALSNPKVTTILLPKKAPYKFMRDEELKNAGFSLNKLSSKGLLLARRVNSTGRTIDCKEE